MFISKKKKKLNPKIIWIFVLTIQIARENFLFEGKKK